MQIYHYMNKAISLGLVVLIILISLISGYAQETEFSILEDLSDKKKIDFTQENILFMGGISAFSIENCIIDYLSIEDQLTLTNFVQATLYSSLLGNSLDEKSIWKDGFHGFERAPYHVSGYKLAESLNCDSSKLKDITIGIIHNLNINSKSSNDGPSKFVATCAPYYSREQCECAALEAIADIPYIHQLKYEPNLMNRIAERNPVLILRMFSKCGITK